MAELVKKMNFKDSAGVVTQATLYSTTDEAGEEYKSLKVDGVAAYVGVGAVGDDDATSGRFKKDGTTKAYLSEVASVPYTEVSYVEVGTHTFTVPAGVKKLKLAICGGGGGWTEVLTGGKGGDSKFGSIVATGGGSSPSGATAGTPNGKCNTVTTLPALNLTTYQKGFQLDFTLSEGTFGSGGTFAYSFAVNLPSGASLPATGGKYIGELEVTSGSVYSVVVGAGDGIDDTDYTDGSGEKAGTSGFVLIAYGGDI